MGAVPGFSPARPGGVVYGELRMPRIAIVEDNRVIRESLEKLVNELPGYRCVCACDSAEDALREIPRHTPDIVMMDIHLPNMSGIQCAAGLKERFPELQILMLTVYEDEDKIFRALQAGASGYILKRNGTDEIIEALEELRQGGAPMTSAIARKVVASFRSKPTAAAMPHLSRRETEILDCLTRGLANKEIADQLNISVATTRWHLKQIYEKLHVRSRTEAAMKFVGAQSKV
jgi:DNA-binding NarL/FixJ family response regulator